MSAPSPPVPGPDVYTVSFGSAPTNRLLYSVKLGVGVVYSGDGTANRGIILVVGKRRLNGRILQGNQAKVVSLYGSKRLTVVKVNTNTPAPQGGRIKLSFAPNFNPEGVTLTSLTLSNLTQPGARLTSTRRRQLVPADLGTTSSGSSLVVRLEAQDGRTFSSLPNLCPFRASSYSHDHRFLRLRCHLVFWVHKPQPQAI